MSSNGTDLASPAGSDAVSAVKQRTALLSVCSNGALILLKVIAGTITGSVAILIAAVHSSIDLIAWSAAIGFAAIRRLLGHGEVHTTGIGCDRGRSSIRSARGAARRELPDVDRC